MQQCIVANGVPIEEWANELSFFAYLSPLRTKVKGTQVLIARHTLKIECGIFCILFSRWLQETIDPKPDELTMGRVNPRESEGEARTV